MIPLPSFRIFDFGKIFKPRDSRKLCLTGPSASIPPFLADVKYIVGLLVVLHRSFHREFLWSFWDYSDLDHHEREECMQPAQQHQTGSESDVCGISCVVYGRGDGSADRDSPASDYVSVFLFVLL
jgi:hypothetical protein